MSRYPKSRIASLSLSLHIDMPVGIDPQLSTNNTRRKSSIPEMTREEQCCDEGDHLLPPHVEEVAASGCSGHAGAIMRRQQQPEVVVRLRGLLCDGGRLLVTSSEGAPGQRGINHQVSWMIFQQWIKVNGASYEPDFRWSETGFN